MEVGDKVIYIGTHDEDLFSIYGNDAIDLKSWDVKFFHLKYNQTYEVKEPKYDWDEVLDNEICVRNDKGDDIIIDKKYFKTLAELRKDKLNEIESRK